MAGPRPRMTLWMRMSQSASDSRIRAVEILWDIILWSGRGGKKVMFLVGGGWMGWEWRGYLFQVRT